MRHSKASDVLRYLDEGEVPGFCDKQQLLTHLSQHRMLSGVELIQRNIVDEQQARHIYSASHVFAFDVLIGDVLMQHIVNHIQRRSSLPALIMLVVPFTWTTLSMRPTFQQRCGPTAVFSVRPWTYPTVYSVTRCQSTATALLTTNCVPSRMR
jgi:hypothetical protein